MSRTLGLNLALSVSLVALLGATAPKAHAAELAWALAGNKLRYDLEAQPPAGAPPSAPVLAPFRLVGATDFKGGLPLLAIEDPGDLVWHYAFLLPDAKLKKRSKAPVIVEANDVFAVKGGELRASGNHSLRRRGKRIRIRSSLVVTSSVKNHWLKKANLVVTRVFNPKKGRIEIAEFRFETRLELEGETLPFVWQGRITPAKKDVAVSSEAFHVEVQEAIDKAKAWLLLKTRTRLGEFRKRPSYARPMLGQMALPCFALLRAGLAPNQLVQEFAWMTRQPLSDTSSVALWIMALEARYVTREPIAPRPMTRSVARFKRGQLPKGDTELMAKAVKWLVATRKHDEGWWSYEGTPGETPLNHKGTTSKNGDRSNSQFAVLALHAALAHGIKVPPKVWEEVYEETVGKSQAGKGPSVSLEGSELNTSSPLKHDPRDDAVVRPGVTTERRAPALSTDERLNAKARGWAYPTATQATPENAYGSMSAAGVSTVAIVREGLRISRRLTSERALGALVSLRDGLGWLLQNYDPTRNPKRGAAHYFYFAYSFEKAMDTSGVERLGDKEWWRDLAAELIARQKDDGSWEGTIKATSLALLVLNRATLPVELEIGEAQRRATGEQDPSLWDLVVVPGTGQLRVRQLLEAMRSDPSLAAERLPLARKALAAMPSEERPRVVPELLLLMDHSHRSTKRWARESVRLLTGSVEPKAIDAFSTAWETLRRASIASDHARIPELRQVLGAKTSAIPLKKQALLVLGRLRAIEATGDVISELSTQDPGYREFAWSYLISLTGGEQRPFDPGASKGTRSQQIATWNAWWMSNKDSLTQAEEIRRAVSDLALKPRADAAAERLKKIGKPALRALVDGLRSDTTRKRAHELLKAISGKDLPAEVAPWLDLLE